MTCSTASILVNHRSGRWFCNRGRAPELGLAMGPLGGHKNALAFRRDVQHQARMRHLTSNHGHSGRRGRKSDVVHTYRVLPGIQVRNCELTLVVSSGRAASRVHAYRRSRQCGSTLVFGSAGDATAATRRGP